MPCLTHSKPEWIRGIMSFTEKIGGSEVHRCNRIISVRLVIIEHRSSNANFRYRRTDCEDYKKVENLYLFLLVVFRVLVQLVVVEHFGL
jgi:hypothetical protein